jgi:hypothetical protein
VKIASAARHGGVNIRRSSSTNGDFEGPRNSIEFVALP